MIRALQKKFVITSMTAISVLLLVLLGGINITNIVLSEKETSRTLGWITAQELGEFPDKPFSGNKSTAPDADKPPKPPSPFGQGRNAKDAILSSNYFVVRTDLTGEVLLHRCHPRLDLKRGGRGCARLRHLAGCPTPTAQAEGTNIPCVQTKKKKRSCSSFWTPRRISFPPCVSFCFPPRSAYSAGSSCCCS